MTAAKGQFLTAKFRYDEAIPEYETVIAFNRNSADAYAIAVIKASDVMVAK
jgi:hypothetical protein